MQVRAYRLKKKTITIMIVKEIIRRYPCQKIIIRKQISVNFGAFLLKIITFNRFLINLLDLNSFL